MRSFQKYNRENNHASNILIQPSLEIGKEDDEHEKEANHVADKVMKMPDPSASIQKMHNKEEEKEKMVEGGKKVQMMVDSPLKISKMTNYPDSGLTASPNVEQGINSSKGKGQSLDIGLQSELGNKMGADFSEVKLHTGENAVQMNKEIGAKAFTHGNDIYFNSGQYNPATNTGKYLLAHELTHTVQQGNRVKRKIQAALLPDQIKAAKEYNEVVFKDPAEIASLRDILGIAAEPAAVDDDFVNAVAKFQVDNGLSEDGKIGQGTAKVLAEKIQAKVLELGDEANVGAPERMSPMALLKRMQLRAKLENGLGVQTHQGFVGDENDPEGIVNVYENAMRPKVGRGRISIGYTGKDANKKHWLQFVTDKMLAYEPGSDKPVYNTGSFHATNGDMFYSDNKTNNWAVDSGDPANPYYEAAGANTSNPGKTRIFDTPGRGWQSDAEGFANRLHPKPNKVIFIADFETYLVENLQCKYRVRWQGVVTFDTSVTPVVYPGTYYYTKDAGSYNGNLRRELKDVLIADGYGAYKIK